MAVVSAHDIARELRERLGNHGGDRVKIQKLIYYCQGLHLAATDQPLFADRIEAFENGPVVREVWDADRGRSAFNPPPSPLSALQAEVVDMVVERYGHLTGGQLIDKTHEERPWKQSYEQLGRNAEISHHLMREFFREQERLPDIEARLDELRRRRPDPLVAPRMSKALEERLAR
jgi:uncharacterized phage-associated protein